MAAVGYAVNSAVLSTGSYSINLDLPRTQAAEAGRNPQTLFRIERDIPDGTSNTMLLIEQLAACSSSTPSLVSTLTEYPVHHAWTQPFTFSGSYNPGPPRERHAFDHV